MGDNLIAQHSFEYDNREEIESGYSFIDKEMSIRVRVTDNGGKSYDDTVQLYTTKVDHDLDGVSDYRDDFPYDEKISIVPSDISLDTALSHIRLNALSHIPIHLIQ